MHTSMGSMFRCTRIYLSTDIVEGVPPDEYVGGVGGDAHDPAMASLEVRDGETSRVHMAPKVDVHQGSEMANVLDLFELAHFPDGRVVHQVVHCNCITLTDEDDPFSERGTSYNN